MWKHRLENLKICEKAIDKLRDAGRTYYLVELLEIEIQILETMPEDAVTEHLENETDRINAKELMSMIKNLVCRINKFRYICRIAPTFTNRSGSLV